MSNDDVLYLRKKSKQTLMTIMVTVIPTAIIVVWSAISTRIDERVELEQKADKEYVDDQYSDMYILVNAQQINLANFIKAHDEDKEAIWVELHRNQDRINNLNNKPKDTTRGDDTSQKDVKDPDMLQQQNERSWY